MKLNSLYTDLAIFLAFILIHYYSLKILEAKRNIHIFPYSMRKLFIEEHKDASSFAHDLFERKLLERDKRDQVTIILIIITLPVLIILEAKLVPFDLNIVVPYSTFNYYFFTYFTGIGVSAFLLFAPLIWGVEIHKLGISRTWRKHIHGKAKNSQFNENKDKRRMIRLYHYIKYFGFVSPSAIVGLFIQSLVVEETPYFYYQTNIVIAFLPSAVFVILALIISLGGKLRIWMMYELENYFLMKGWIASLPETDRTLLLKTLDSGMFSDRPQICYLEEIGSKLKISYKWEKELFVSYVKWKSVAAFGFPNVKPKEVFKKVLKEEGTDTDSKFDN